MRALSLLATIVGCSSLALAQDTVWNLDANAPASYDLNGSNFTYPFPVKLYQFTSQRQQIEMAFMDVSPTCEPNGKTAVLLHGRNFCAATWEETIRVLSGAGYRVIAVDQIGFCKSTKPERYQFSLAQLAQNTRNLLTTVGVGNVTVIGHSLGGMLATRFGRMFADSIDRLVIVNALGLEDYIALGVPYRGVDENFVTEAAMTHDSIRAYEQDTYYVGQWKPEYDVWVDMLVNIYHGSKAATYALDQAQVIDTVLTQPIAHEFALLQPRTLLLIGDKDNTAIGKQWAPPEVAAKLGHFDVLGPSVVAQIPNAELIHFPDLGHAPQISEPERFHAALLGWLSNE
ncbi:alpha/beta-hydrolase [Auricularia subglabra TFB-10046 SS5]|nr:alpha/beta-hydrolase [Auricularia subglabra TFB-10046 SS5]